MKFAGALAAAGIGAAIWAAGLAPASADPVLPVDPAIPLPVPADAAAAPPADPAAAPEPAAAPQTMLGQFAQAAKSDPVASMNALLANPAQPALIGLPPTAPGTAPAPDPFSLAQLLMPQNFRMPTADQESPYALQPNTNPSPFARIEAYRGVHALAHSNIGRMPGDQLGQPLPGTAPPPGTSIPAGLEQFYVGPAAAPAPADPKAAPGPVAAPAPADPAVVPPPVDPLLLPAVPAPPS